MNEVTNLTKQFMEKHSFTLDKDLKKVVFNQPADELLKDVASVLSTCAKVLDDNSKKLNDPRIHRAQLMVEESSEIIFGLAERDEVEILDGLSDLIFVTIGTALTFDLPLEAGVLEVCKSNLTKAVRQSGNERLRDKGSDYVAPDMKKILKEYGE